MCCSWLSIALNGQTSCPDLLVYGDDEDQDEEDEEDGENEDEDEVDEGVRVRVYLS